MAIGALGLMPKKEHIEQTLASYGYVLDDLSERIVKYQRLEDRAKVDETRETITIVKRSMGELTQELSELEKAEVANG